MKIYQNKYDLTEQYRLHKNELYEKYKDNSPLNSFKTQSFFDNNEGYFLLNENVLDLSKIKPNTVVICPSSDVEFTKVKTLLDKKNYKYNSYNYTLDIKKEFTHDCFFIENNNQYFTFGADIYDSRKVYKINAIDFLEYNKVRYITKDNVSIYNGDWMVIYDKFLQKICSIVQVNEKFTLIPNENFLLFSTAQEALKYYDTNKPTKPIIITKDGYKLNTKQDKILYAINKTDYNIFAINIRYYDSNLPIIAIFLEEKNAIEYVNKNKPKIIFTSKDDIDIYDKSKKFYVVEESIAGYYILNKYCELYSKNDGKLYFVSLDKAEKFIENDIKNNRKYDTLIDAIKNAKSKHKNYEAFIKDLREDIDFNK